MRLLLLPAFLGLALPPTLCWADTFEERAWTVGSASLLSPFTLNPASVSTNPTILSFAQLTRNESSEYLLNPGQNQTKARHKATERDYALAGQMPLGGAAFGLGVNQLQRVVTARNENRGADQKEEFFIRDHKMKFVVDLTPELRGAFQFRYQSQQAELFGSYFIDDLDKTRYKGTMSGYGIGLYYQLRGMGIGAFSTPPLRGKAIIEGEQKIISDPGMLGFEFNFDVDERTKAQISVLQWSYKRDDRDDDSTSPVDQTGILLRGLELDQYFRKTMAIGLMGAYSLSPIVHVKGSLVKQDGVFFFDQNADVGDDSNLETKLDAWELRAGVGLKKQQFMAEAMLSQTSRKKDSIQVNRGEVGLARLGSYEHSASAVMIMLGAAL
jgi:hypothetical protein